VDVALGVENRIRKEPGRAPIAPAKFYSLTDGEQNTREQVHKARSHPWISQDVPVRGFIYDVNTGRPTEVFGLTPGTIQSPSGPVTHLLLAEPAQLVGLLTGRIRWPHRRERVRQRSRGLVVADDRSTLRRC
jgi:hypothetical protein